MVAPLVFKLIVPATQCGSIIGKGGSKIKEIRETSGASIQVASDMLPNSTERTVTITGNPDTITQCIYQVCLILMEVRSTSHGLYKLLIVVSNLFYFIFCSVSSSRYRRSLSPETLSVARFVSRRPAK